MKIKISLSDSQEIPNTNPVKVRSKVKRNRKMERNFGLNKTVTVTKAQ